MIFTPIPLHLLVIAIVVGSCYSECEFSGETYATGETIPNICTVITCKEDGSWELGSLVSECDTCTGTNSFTVRTFDEPDDPVAILSAHCGISFAQEYNVTYLIDETIEPQFGVFVEFELCGTAGISPCLDYVTFRTEVSGENDVVVRHSDVSAAEVGGTCTVTLVEEPQTLQLNGSDIDVIGWLGQEEDTTCAFLQGPQFTAVVCPESLQVKAQEALHERVAGLCGYYDGNGDDDRITRDGSTLMDPLPILYTVLAHSWMTKEQNECGRTTGFGTPHSSPVDELMCPNQNTYSAVCRRVLFTVNTFLSDIAYFLLDDFCVSMLCSNALHLDVLVPVLMKFVLEVAVVELLI